MKPETALADLLGSLFNATELMVYLAGEPDGDKLKDLLPGAIAPFVALRAAAVEVLGKRGLVNRSFFERLEEACPRRADEIRKVRLIWMTHALDMEASADPRPSRVIFILRVGADNDIRRELGNSLATQNEDLSILDVELTDALARETVVQRHIDDCVGCLILDSPALRASAALDSRALRRLTARLHNGDLLALVIPVRPVPAGPGRVPEILARAQTPLLGRAALMDMTATDRSRAWLDVAVSLAQLAKTHSLARRLIAIHARPGDILDWWREASPPGRPEPATGGSFVELAWAAALDVTACEAVYLCVSRPRRSIATLRLATARDPGSIVRVSIDPLPGQEDAWVIRAWCLDAHGVHPIPIQDPHITRKSQPEILQRVFNTDAPPPQLVERLELVCDLLDRDWPVEDWQIDDGFGPISFPAPITLRERMRHQRRHLRELLVQRTQAHWRDPAVPSIGPGGDGCIAQTQCIDATVIKDEATRRFQHSAAVCAGLLGLPPSGKERLARLAEILRWGLPVALWARTTDGAGDEALRALLSIAEIPRLPEAVYRRRRDTMPAPPPGGHFSLLFEDPAFPLPDDHFTSPI